jgi:cell wall-associated NlpC family hydrolase
MSESAERERVVQEALSWQGTRYHHMGRIKQRRDDAGIIIDKGGVDCGQYILMVFVNAGLIAEPPLAYYPPDWHMHRDVEKYLSIVLEHCREMALDEPMLPGDIVLYRFGFVHSHGGIVIPPGWPNIMHAYRETMRVTADTASGGRLGTRPQRHFSYWGK